MRKFTFSTLLILVVAICQTSEVQSQVTGWINTEQGMGVSVCSDQFDNVYTSGQFVGTTTIGGTPFTSQGLQDIIIEKRDPSGTIIWATPFGGTQGDFSSKIIYDGMGKVWVTGTFRGTMTAGSFTVVSSGGSDVFLVCLDASTGAIVYADHGGGSGDDAGTSVGTGISGDIILAGTFTGSFGMGGVTLTGQGMDIFIIRFDNAGNAQWGKKISGTALETMWSMTTDLTGNIYIAGYTSSAAVNFAGTSVNFASASVFVVKFDDQGSYGWSAPAQFNGEVYGICSDAAGSVYFTGNFDTQATIGSFTLTGAGNDDILVVKISSTGTFVRAQSYGGTGIDEGYDMRSDMQGNLFIAGSFQGSFTFGTTIINAGGFSKSYTAKIDTSGAVDWVIQSGGAASSHITSGIDINNYGDLYITGNGSGVFNMGSFSDSVAGSYLVKISDHANIIKGTVFADLNNDGIFDPGEPGLPNMITELDNGPYVSASDGAGIYHVYCASGTHSVSIPNLPSYYTLTTAPLLTSVFTGMGAMDTARNFGFYPVAGVNDLNIDITPVSSPKAGHVLSYFITYKNAGTTTLNSTVTLQYDPAISYLYASPSPSVQAGQTITWNTGTLAPMASGTIHAHFNIPSNLAIGFPITATAGITPLISDSTPGDNSRTIVTPVTGPYDPNYKEVNIDTLYSVSTPGWLEYTIHFQNVGNDTAFNVIITDTLSPYLDHATFEIISSAHPVSAFSIKSGDAAEFRFNGIMLPDSAADATGSCGFVKYRMKYLSTIPVNGSVANAADIFFDYNLPVRTNTVFTYHIDSMAGIDENAADAALIYPNPAGDYLIIENKDLPSNTLIRLYTVQGVMIREQPLVNTRMVLDITEYAHGLYFVRIENGKHVSIRKFIKE